MLDAGGWYFGRKRTYIYSKSQLFNVIELNNKVMDCFVSLYSYPDKNNPNNFLVDKIMLDFDSDNFLDNVKKTHTYLMEKNVKHIISFTGGGCHIYVFVKPFKNGNSRDYISALQNKIAADVGLSIGDPVKSDLDVQTIGKDKLFFRMPRTYNIKKKRYVFFFTEQDLGLSKTEILQKAMTQQLQGELFGKELLTLTEQDFTSFRTCETKNEFVCLDTTKLPNDVKPLVQMLPNTVQNLLLNGKCGFQERFVTILAMRECGYPITVAKSVCKHFWTPYKYKHSNGEERQFEYLYNRTDMLFPNWVRVQELGISVDWDNDINYNFYR